MKSNILINVEKEEYISDYRKAGVSAFLFALEDFCVGYENTFSKEEVENINVSKKFLLINRVLDCEAVDKLKKILINIKNIDGIIYEDIAVYNIVKDLNINIELISFQNHFGTNVGSINFWLNRVNSVFVSNELSLEEIKNILKNVNREVCLHIFGYNQIMYSRRLLLSNWSEEFNIPYKNKNILEEKATKMKFKVMENKYGTVFYSGKIFNGLELLKLENVKYGYINTTGIEHEEIMKVLKTLTYDGECDNGFLEHETIYKLKERSK